MMKVYVPPSPGRRVLLGFAFMAVATAASMLLDSVMGGHSLFLLLGGVVCSALYGGLALGVAMAILAGFAHNYLFQYPKLLWGIHSDRDALQLAVFLSVSIALSWLGDFVRRSRDAAEQASRLREDMVAVVSHDLRNPLSAIRINAELILKRAGEGAITDELTCRSAEQIRRSADGMSRLMEDLLAFEKIRAGRLDVEPHACTARTLLADARALAEPLAERRHLRLEILDGAPGAEVRCDPLRVNQVFSNLIGNAVKFTPPGGKLEIGAEVLAGELQFRVRDTGAGIAADQLPHVFDRYWQARQTARHGTGLGLSIAKGIVEAHGGVIRAESHEGQGTTFFFTLPREMPPVYPAAGA